MRIGVLLPLGFDHATERSKKKAGSFILVSEGSVDSGTQWSVVPPDEGILHK
jgi:hypothetical protein